MRTRQHSSDSLELLLDTICNTFGGVVFIAVLVILLVQQSGQQPVEHMESVVPAKVIEELNQQLDALNHELPELNKTALQQERLIAQLAPEDVQVLLEERNRMRAKVRNLLQTRDEFLSSVAIKAGRIARIRDELSTLRDSLQKVERELAAAEAKVEAVRATRTRTAGTPLVQTTNKTPVLLIVRYGRTYVWHHYGQAGDRQGLNTEEFVVLGEQAGGIVTTPNPAAGVVLNKSAETVSLIRRRLALFDPRMTFLDIAVRSDSFGEFHFLRDALARSGYEYSLLPLSNDTVLIDRGGEGRGVQ